jgi:hypothetical protein
MRRINFLAGYLWIGNIRTSNSYPGLSLREMVHQFKHQILVLFKCLLLQPKVQSISFCLDFGFLIGSRCYSLDQTANDYV